METPRKILKHMKASVEIVIGTKDLIAGKPGEAREFERCTPFFDTFEEVEQCGEWPGDAESAKEYDQRMQLFPDYKEHLHPLIWAPTLKHLKERQEFSAAECIECAIQSQFLPLKKLTLFGYKYYDRSSLISKLPNQGEFVSQNIQKRSKTPQFIVQKLSKLSCLGVGELLTKIAYTRFSKPSINRHVRCFDYQLFIDESADGYEIAAVSKWNTCDMSKERSPKISTFGALLTAKISKTELTSAVPEHIDYTLEIRKI